MKQKNQETLKKSRSLPKTTEPQTEKETKRNYQLKKV
jgi:hypothetical protein